MDKDRSLCLGHGQESYKPFLVMLLYLIKATLYHHDSSPCWADQTAGSCPAEYSSHNYRDCDRGHQTLPWARWTDIDQCLAADWAPSRWSISTWGERSICVIVAIIWYNFFIV